MVDGQLLIWCLSVLSEDLESLGINGEDLFIAVGGLYLCDMLRRRKCYFLLKNRIFKQSILLKFSKLSEISSDLLI